MLKSVRLTLLLILGFGGLLFYLEIILAYNAYNISQEFKIRVFFFLYETFLKF